MEHAEHSRGHAKAPNADGCAPGSPPGALRNVGVVNSRENVLHTLMRQLYAFGSDGGGVKERIERLIAEAPGVSGDPERRAWLVAAQNPIRNSCARPMVIPIASAGGNSSVARQR